MSSEIDQPAVPDEPPIKVYFVSTSLSHSRRGIESFFRECFDAMHSYPGVQAELFKGSGDEGQDEHRLWCLPKFGWPAKLLGKLLKRSPYTIEQVSFYPAFARRIRKGKPDVIFYSDNNLAMQIQKRRHKFPSPFKMLYSNGAALPPPFTGVDHVQQVTPTYYQKAIDAGEPPDKHTLLPYGIHVPEGDPIWDREQRLAFRRQLQLPPDRPLVLSVGWISAELKRMDYLIDEMASLPQPRPFVVLLGEIDEKSPPIIQQAGEKLGYGNYAIRSVPYEQVGHYYALRHVFALASLEEGFGRVFLEALIHGLPCIASDHPIMRYVLGKQGTFGDLSQVGMLASLVQAELRKRPDPAAMARRRDYVRQKFSWDVLRAAYLQMFKDAIAGTASAPPEAASMAEAGVPSDAVGDASAQVADEPDLSVEISPPADDQNPETPPADEPTSA